MSRCRESDRESFEKVLGSGTYGVVEKHGKEARKYSEGRPSEGINACSLNEMLALRLLESQSLSYHVEGRYQEPNDTKGDVTEFVISMPVFGASLDVWSYNTPYTVRVQWVDRCFPLLFRELKKIHALGIVHGDIRNNNILVSKYGATFIDYGSSRINMRGGMSYLNAIDSYRAPEYDAFSIVGVEVDYWALASTMYFVLCKRNPPTLRQMTEITCLSLQDMASSDGYYRGIDYLLHSSRISETTKELFRHCYSYNRERRRMTIPELCIDTNTTESNVMEWNDNREVNPRFLPSDDEYMNKELDDDEYYRLLVDIKPGRLGLDIWDRYLSSHHINNYRSSLVVCNALAQKILTYKGTVYSREETLMEKKILGDMRYLLVYSRGSGQQKWLQKPLPNLSPDIHLHNRHVRY